MSIKNPEIYIKKLESASQVGHIKSTAWTHIIRLCCGDPEYKSRVVALISDKIQKFKAGEMADMAKFVQTTQLKHWEAKLQAIYSSNLIHPGL